MTILQLKLLHLIAEQKGAFLYHTSSQARQACYKLMSATLSPLRIISEDDVKILVDAGYLMACEENQQKGYRGAIRLDRAKYSQNFPLRKLATK